MTWLDNSIVQTTTVDTRRDAIKGQPLDGAVQHGQTGGQSGTVGHSS